MLRSVGGTLPVLAYSRLLSLFPTKRKRAFPFVACWSMAHAGRELNFRALASLLSKIFQLEKEVDSGLTWWITRKRF